jgi:hypothetical protein
MAQQDRAHLRSFVCVAGHELRVTKRCLLEDLKEPADTPFDELVGRHDMVRALRRERRAATAGPDTLGPAGGDRPLTVLRHRHRWRGVTWFEPAQAVVWLCGCSGSHRSGAADDAFPYLEALRDEGRIWPTDDDREALEADRGQRFAALVVTDAPVLLAAARAAPGTERRAMIGLEPIAIVVHVVDTLEETFVAISGRLEVALLQILLVSLYPDSRFDEWRHVDRLPTRELDPTRGEFCLSIVHDQ